MKRILSLLLIITLLLCACTSPEVPESGEVQEPVESVESSDLPENVEEPVENVETQEDEIEIETTETSDEFSESSEVLDYNEFIEISDELVKEMGVFFQTFLKAYIAGDEETFKSCMSEELYSEYLEHQINTPTPDEWWLYYRNVGLLNSLKNNLNENFGGGLILFNPNLPWIHDPGITFLTHLIKQGEVYKNHNFGDKYLVNISHNENYKFSINWIRQESDF